MTTDNFRSLKAYVTVGVLLLVLSIVMLAALLLHPSWRIGPTDFTCGLLFGLGFALTVGGAWKGRQVGRQG